MSMGAVEPGCILRRVFNSLLMKKRPGLTQAATNCNLPMVFSNCFLDMLRCSANAETSDSISSCLSAVTSMVPVIALNRTPRNSQTYVGRTALSGASWAPMSTNICVSAA